MNDGKRALALIIGLGITVVGLYLLVSSPERVGCAPGGGCISYKTYLPNLIGVMLSIVGGAMIFVSGRRRQHIVRPS